MKICLVSNLYPPYILGGAEIYAERVAKYLAKENEVIVITTKPFSGLSSLKPSVEYKDRVKIYRFFPLNFYYTYYCAQKTFLVKPFWHLIDLWNPHSYFVIKNIAKKEKPDVVHTHNLGGLSTSAASAIRPLRIPHVHTLHDYALLSPWSNLLRSGKIIKKFNIFDKICQKVKRYFMNEVDVIIAPSKFVMNGHIKNGFFLNCKKIVLPSGIELPKQKSVEKSYEIIDILYVGQVSEYKGVDILIKASKKIDSDNTQLHIIGEGAGLEKFKKLAGGDKRIKFYGFLQRQELKELYKKANLLIVPSICYDNSPTVIYESFSFGIPVIGSRIGGIPELIEEGYNGFLFEAGNVEELEDMINKVIKKPEQLREMGRNALDFVKKYEITVHVSELMKIYREEVL